MRGVDDPELSKLGSCCSGTKTGAWGPIGAGGASGGGGGVTRGGVASGDAAPGELGDGAESPADGVLGAGGVCAEEDGVGVVAESCDEEEADGGVCGAGEALGVMGDPGAIAASGAGVVSFWAREAALGGLESGWVAASAKGCAVGEPELAVVAGTLPAELDSASVPDKGDTKDKVTSTYFVSSLGGKG